VESCHTGSQLSEHRVRCAPHTPRPTRRPDRKCERHAPQLVSRPHPAARARDRQPRDGGRQRAPIAIPAGRPEQRGDSESGEVVIAEKQPKQVADIANSVVHRRGGHEQHARIDDQTSERTIAPRARVPEAMGFVNKK